MKSLLRKIITFVVIISMFTTLTSGVYAKSIDKPVNVGWKYESKATHTAIFKGGNIKAINSNDELSTDSKDLIISYLNGKMNLIFDMNSGSRSGLVNLSVSLYPSQVKLFRGKALIGKVESINDPYELLSFRIENDSSTHTLMRPNLYMEGHIVLTVGLLDHSTNDIYYLQQIVDDLNFTQMLSDAENSYATNNVSSQYLIDLKKIISD